VPSGVTSHTKVDYTVESIDATDRSAVILAYESAWAGDPKPPVEIGARCDWLYAANPAGHARLLRLRTSTNESVGMVAVVPRRFWLADSSFTLGLLCDFIVHRGHRTLMPALLLQRAAREVADRVFGGTYAIPNDKSLPVIRRLGDSIVEQRPRLARVMKSHSYLAQRSTALARVASWPLDTAAVAWENVVAASRPRLHAEWLTAFDDRFDDLWRHRPPSSCLGERSSQFLRWRFGSEPNRRNLIVGVFDRRAGQLMAYCVGTHSGKTFEIRDFQCFLDPAGHRASLALMMQKVRSLDVESVSFRLYANRPVKACFHQLAFRAREFESVFLHSRAGSSRFPDQITRADEDV
jgi:hypothetical protein